MTCFRNLGSPNAHRRVSGRGRSFTHIRTKLSFHGGQAGRETSFGGAVKNAPEHHKTFLPLWGLQVRVFPRRRSNVRPFLGARGADYAPGTVENAFFSSPSGAKALGPCPEEY